MMTSANPNRRNKGNYGVRVFCTAFCLLCFLIFPFHGMAVVIQGNNCVEGNGVSRVEKRDMPSTVSKIQADGAFDIKILAGSAPSLTIEADENIVPHIQTKVDGDTLYIRTRRSVCTSAPMTVKVSMVHLDRLRVDGSNDIDVKGLKDNLTLDMDGSSTVFLSGGVQRLQIDMKGAGDVKAEGLRADDVFIKMTGAGEAVVHAVKLLDVTVDGAGTVQYRGNPKIIKKISGVGDIEPLS